MTSAPSTDDNRKRWMVGGLIVGALVPGLISGVQLALSGQGFVAIPYMMVAAAVLGAFVGAVAFEIIRRTVGTGR